MTLNDLSRETVMGILGGLYLTLAAITIVLLIVANVTGERRFTIAGLVVFAIAVVLALDGRRRFKTTDNGGQPE